MKQVRTSWRPWALLLIACVAPLQAQVAQSVIDIPTRPGVTQDGCAICSFTDVPALMAKLGDAPRKQLLAFKGGVNQGDPCEALAYHGFNGLERDVVQQTVAWMLAK